MLTHLRLKNWRSLRDVEIADLTPITVFIGANSSGKTNILDALYFLRNIAEEGIVQTVYTWGGRQKICSLNANKHETVSLEFTYSLPDTVPLTKSVQLAFHERDIPFLYGQRLVAGDQIIFDDPPLEFPKPDGDEDLTIHWGQDFHEQSKHVAELTRVIDTFVRDRWQMLDENFMPPLSIASRTTGDVYVIERCADNLLIMLDFMQKTRPDLYNQLQIDVSWLLGHIDHIFTERTEQETRLVLTEKGFEGREAPTVSAGTARVLAMLTAFYALDMRYATFPGLVVIEEPDTALNPGLLRNFVEQLRDYVNGENPRQVMLTTHNPAFLDYFKPEEVRVVMRNEDGDTTVNAIPDPVRKIWLDEYGLGEVWRTNSFGGLP